MKSLRDTGCPAFTKVYGYQPGNKGLLLLLFHQQLIGRPGCIEGTFEVLAPGVGKYSDLFRSLMRTKTTAEEFGRWAGAKALATAVRGLYASALSISGLDVDEKKPNVFLCHASEDKETARDLYQRLRDDGFRPWLDEEDLLPGHDWEGEIRSAIRRSDAVVVLLSSRSIFKEGFIQREIRMVLDVADEKPDGTIFLMPALLEDCAVPARLRRWQWARLDGESGYNRLKAALELRATSLGKWIESSRFWKPGDDPLRARIDQMNQEEVRLWLHAVGADSSIFRKERGAEWPQTYLHGCRVFEELSDI
jgi:hypothetical protein